MRLIHFISYHTSLTANRIWFLAWLLVLCIACSKPEVTTPTVERWDIFEITLEGPQTGNPYLEVALAAQFANGEHELEVPGFYDGNGTYRIRFSPEILGDWNYKVVSNNEMLDQIEGSFRCIENTGDNHGPVRVANDYYLEYADGTDYFAVGTTAYQWTSVAPEIQQKTLQTLSTGPFNKIRMCVFPKYYRYGNDSEPWAYPYHRKDTISDFDRPNFEFFQNFDQRVKELLELGVQADVILFHPYDKHWGYYLMGDELNERYVRYMIARISAYRNVWWSLANEWDVPAIKDQVDWESIGKLLQNEDPHQRLRGIHNWYNSEDHFYDHNRPWITHVSAQTSQFWNAHKWRSRYQKPLLFDEMRYEGDVPSGWGNLTSKEMSSYFWMAGLSGGYPTHGDTFRNDADTLTEVRWWAKGGTLVGDSPQRIQFFKEQMDQLPFAKMSPSLMVDSDSSQLSQNIYLLSLEAEQYLAYTTDSARIVRFELPGDSAYQMEVLDTWNMEVIKRDSVDPGTFQYTTERPYSAVWLRKKN